MSVRERRVHMGVLWSVITFFMSSNVLFMVGFVIADRVLYLPTFGYCFLLALAIDECVNIVCATSDNYNNTNTNNNNINNNDNNNTRTTNARRRVWLSWSVAALVLAFYCQYTFLLNRAWSSHLRLWEHAYSVCIIFSQMRKKKTHTHTHIF